MRTRSCMVSAITASLCLGAGSPADVVYESATLGPVGTNAGANVDNTQFLGSRFHLDASADVTAVGGNIGSDGTIFGAIVALSGPGAFPVGPTFTPTELLAFTVFDAGFPDSDFLTPLAVSLPPGDYALVYGSGLFGATGWGRMPTTNPTLPAGVGSFFDGNGFGWGASAFTDMRFVVVPEPVALPAILLAACAIGHRRRR